MRRITSSLIAAGAVAGVAGAVVTYQSAAHVAGAETDKPTVVTAKFLPCEAGTKLVKGVCVRTKHRVVVREAPPVAAPPTTRSVAAVPVRKHSTSLNKNDSPPAPSPSAAPTQLVPVDHESEPGDDHGGHGSDD